MSLLYISNYWVTRRSKPVTGSWTLFYHGLRATSMFKALEIASNKCPGMFQINRVSETKWECVDPESETRYTVEKRDDMPRPPKKANFSYRDHTLPENGQVKKMPEPSSLFS